MIASRAVASGEGCADMAPLGRAERSSLERLPTLQHGIPSHDPSGRVFRLLGPEPLRACSAASMRRLAEGRQGGAVIGGETRRRSFDAAAGSSRWTASRTRLAYRTGTMRYCLLVLDKA